MTWEQLPTAALVTDAGVSVEWAALESHIAALALAKPGSAAGITAYRPGEEKQAAAVQLLTLPQGRLAVEVNIGCGNGGNRYQRVKPAGASDSLRQILIRHGWVARIQAGAVLTPEQALDVVAWVCAESSLHSSLHEAHVAEDLWADIAAGRRSPP
ncbi:hypothetical protein HQQ88_04835 [Curtobacterium sp. VKM Ac-2861]|uniref:hypothetical protein n=1 Tax=Curtobacterium sp. VKM Ac-2861 TaxID=2739016 RepID=UPI0015632EA6|nr:hypothetical protein [Curtobacterium sp. VKM Ac-2861]